jgi:hypothetical protein
MLIFKNSAEVAKYVYSVYAFQHDRHHFCEMPPGGTSQRGILKSPRFILRPNGSRRIHC